MTQELIAIHRASTLTKVNYANIAHQVDKAKLAPVFVTSLGKNRMRLFDKGELLALVAKHYLPSGKSRNPKAPAGRPAFMAPGDDVAETLSGLRTRMDAQNSCLLKEFQKATSVISRIAEAMGLNSQSAPQWVDLTLAK